MNITANIHQVTGVTISKIRQNQIRDDEPYFVRDIRIRTEDGSYELTLFCSGEGKPIVKLEGSDDEL